MSERALTRRVLIQGAAALAALTALVGSPPSARAARPARALVIGATPSGLAAAAALRRAGLQVTLLEASDTIGGPLRRGLRAGQAGALSLVGGAAPSGPPEAWRWPDRTLDLSTGAGRRAARAAAREGVGRGALRAGRRYLRGLSPSGARASLGARSAEDWRADGSPYTPLRPATAPLCRAHLGGPPSGVSAAELALLERRALAQGLDAATRWLDHADWGAVASALSAEGVQIRLGAPTAELLFEGDRVIGAMVGASGVGAQIDALEPDWTALDRPGAPPIFARDDGERIWAFAGRCPADGSTLSIEGDGFISAAGRRYGPDGAPLEPTDGPPMRALFADRGADGIHVEGELPEERLEAEVVIVAAPGPEASALLAGRVAGAEQIPSSPAAIAVLQLSAPPDAPGAYLLMGDAPFFRAFLSADGAELQAAGADLPGDEEAAIEAAGAALRSAWPAAEVQISAATLRRYDAACWPPGWRGLPASPGPGGLWLAGPWTTPTPEDGGSAGLEQEVATGARAASLALAALATR